MTCIVGIGIKGKTILGGDSAATAVSAGLVTQRQTPKVLLRDEYVLGYTSSFRLGDVLRYRIQMPKPKPAELSLEHHLVISWIDYLRKVLKDQGYSTVDKNNEHGGTFLIGYKGELCVIQDDFQVGTPREGYHAVGSGTQLALATLFNVTKDTRMLPQTMLQRALTTAAYYNAYVCEPFNFVTSE